MAGDLYRTVRVFVCCVNCLKETATETCILDVHTCKHNQPLRSHTFVMQQSDVWKASVVALLLWSRLVVRFNDLNWNLADQSARNLLGCIQYVSVL